MINTTLITTLAVQQSILTTRMRSRRSDAEIFLGDSQKCLIIGAFFLIIAVVTTLFIFLDNKRYSFHYASSLDYLVPLLMGFLGIFFLILAAVFR